MKITFFENLVLIGKKWTYILKFSDNIYHMVYSNCDIMECLKIKAIINDRINLYFVKRTLNILKTSDLNFEYIK